MSRGPFQLQNCTALRCFWGTKGGIVGKREHATKIPQRYCPTYTDISRNWAQIPQPGEAPVFPCSTGGAWAEKQQGQIEIWMSVFLLEAVRAQHARGVPGTAVPCPGCLWQERCCSLPGKHRASRDACREPIMDLRLQAARLQHLPECCGAAALTAGSSSTCRDVARPAQLSSTGQMGLGAAGAAFPQQHSLQGIPKALGSQGWGRGPTSISFYCTIFLHSQNTLPAWGDILSPNMTALHSLPM